MAGRPEPTIKNWIKKARAAGTIYEETAMVPNGHGASKVVFFDPATLGIKVPSSSAVDQKSGDPVQKSSGSLQKITRAAVDHLQNPGSETANSGDVQLGVGFSTGSSEMILRNQPGQQIQMKDLDIDAHVEYIYVTLQPILREQDKHVRRRLILKLADDLRVSDRTVYNWVKLLEESQNDIAAIARQKRKDKGYQRVIDDQKRYELQNVFISNTVHTSVRTIYKNLLMFAPDLLEYSTKGGKTKVMSLPTLMRIKKEMLDDPMLRLLFMDATAQDEYLRTYNGRVTTFSSNQLWEMDMTRCDILLFDPATGKTFRPRVHAIIDVHSGCIVGLDFSELEDSDATMAALVRGLTQKSDPAYPWGTPSVLYCDNGKIYTSERLAQLCRYVGVKIVHSRAYVSHTRGAIERWFGILHDFETTLPGYVGPDAVERDNEELEKLTEASREWVSTGKDPGYGNRLMTFLEYKNRVLAWLIGFYHKQPVRGVPRDQLFMQEAAPKSFRKYNDLELLIASGYHTERTVTPDGGVQLDNILYKIPDGSLAPYRAVAIGTRPKYQSSRALAGFNGMRVTIVENRYYLGDDQIAIVNRQKSGHFELIGFAVPAPMIADSAESRELRKAQKRQLKATLEQAQQQKAARARSEFVVSNLQVSALNMQDQVTDTLPAPKAQEVQIDVIAPKELPATDPILARLRGSRPQSLADLKRELEEER
ncbi:DDE-type integrase/transposase/recombinase [Deinococcus cellulosilyticus]|uniref:Transposase n=1 Tax=Deinococcus cellulosilyticus (strain DSM 18568 / NBRC 106333 / KACC 11606 / 5516J-15) TaxID=1223518 RepID=A0A511MWM4_DEIC1|nr:DDE-type integrase/transposase/recombinase [Deinococcus cellulosilyticus]GEM44791.1 transposase [Deinococcus cellulosilyticus NBRC 106333 = KACC 11606]